MGAFEALTISSHRLCRWYLTEASRRRACQSSAIDSKARINLVGRARFEPAQRINRVFWSLVRARACAGPNIVRPGCVSAAHYWAFSTCRKLVQSRVGAREGTPSAELEQVIPTRITHVNVAN